MKNTHPYRGMYENVRFVHHWLGYNPHEWAFGLDGDKLADHVRQGLDKITSDPSQAPEAIDPASKRAAALYYYLACNTEAESRARRNSTSNDYQKIYARKTKEVPTIVSSIPVLGWLSQKFGWSATREVERSPEETAQGYMDRFNAMKSSLRDYLHLVGQPEINANEALGIARELGLRQASSRPKFKIV